MTSPRFVGSALRQRKHLLAFLTALVTLATMPCRAQSTGPAPASGADTAVSLASDSAGLDSVAAAPGDTLRRPGSDSSAPQARRAPPPAPVDSALAAACDGSGGAPPDLLVVTFRPTSTPGERAAVAREVGGALLGGSEHAAPGSWYLRVPGSAGDRSVADRLIQLSPVLQVGATRCPS